MVNDRRAVTGDVGLVARALSAGPISGRVSWLNRGYQREGRDSSMRRNGRSRRCPRACCDAESSYLMAGRLPAPRKPWSSSNTFVRSAERIAVAKTMTAVLQDMPS
jgi:hypothetical protein